MIEGAEHERMDSVFWSRHRKNKYIMVCIEENVFFNESVFLKPYSLTVKKKKHQMMMTMMRMMMMRRMRMMMHEAL